MNETSAVQIVTFKGYFFSVEHLASGIYRSSRSQMFFKKGVLKNFAKFTEKHLCCSLFYPSGLQLY